MFGINSNLNSAWVDHMHMSVREDVPIAMLAFYTRLPQIEQRLEAARIVTSLEHVHRMIDVLCENTDYYPERPKKDG